MLAHAAEMARRARRAFRGPAGRLCLDRLRAPAGFGAVPCTTSTTCSATSTCPPTALTTPVTRPCARLHAVYPCQASDQPLAGGRARAERGGGADRLGDLGSMTHSAEQVPGRTARHLVE